MTTTEKTYQYRLTKAECQLYNLLRRLEADFEVDYPGIFEGASLTKLFVDNLIRAQVRRLMQNIGTRHCHCLSN